MNRRSLALAPAAVLLAATLVSCSTDGDAPASDCVASGSVSDAVEVAGEFGEELSLASDTPVSVKKSERTVLTEGDGEEITDGETFFITLNVFDGNDGSLIEHSRAPLNNSDGYQDWVAETLNCASVGDRVTLAVPAQDVYGDENAEPEDALIIVSDIEGPALEKAEGEEVPLPEGTPEVSIGDSGEPDITIPEGLTAPSELEVHTMVEGEGREIEPGDEVFVHYKGIIWRTGETFDSSWERGTFINFNAASDEEAQELQVPTPVIRGFRDALVGQTVGSRVMSIVPAEDGGYGADQLTSQGHEPDDVMVFVLDILEATPLN